MNTLLNSPHQRAIFSGTIAALVLRAQLLETKIVIALMDTPTHRQIAILVEADEQLGKAAAALREAARLIETL